MAETSSKNGHSVNNGEAPHWIDQPNTERVLAVCTGPSCLRKGARDLLRNLQREGRIAANLT